MTSPAPGLYKLWAIVSSLVCVGLAGYIVSSHVLAPERDASEAAGPGDPNGLDLEPDIAEPPWLRDLGGEWMSRSLEPDATGVALWIDSTGSRELVVERCTHQGYFDIALDRPRDNDWSFCETMLRGSIESVAGDDRLAVRSIDGALVQVRVEITEAGDAPRLVMGLGDARLDLVPGSRNDLYQRMDAIPAIRAEHEAWLRQMLPRDSEGPDGPDRSR